METQTVYIYGLVDPETDQIRYVGKTKKHVWKRLREHICDSQQLYPGKRAWIRDLLSHGTEPQIVILEVTDAEGWEEAERRWIADLTAAGNELFNIRAGGAHSGRLLRPVETHLNHRALAPIAPPDPIEASELRQMREALGLSQRRFAQSLGYSPATVSLWESGKRHIPASIRLAVERLSRK